MKICKLQQILLVRMGLMENIDQVMVIKMFRLDKMKMVRMDYQLKK